MSPLSRILSTSLQQSGRRDLIGLDICGVDFLLPDAARPYTEAGGAILEVNQRPAFDMHDAATNWNNVVRETIVRCMMAQHNRSVPILRMKTSTHRQTIEQVRQLTKSLSEAMGMTVGLVVPGGEGAAIRGSWLPQLRGDSASLVRGLLADQRVEMVVFLDHEGADSVVPREAVTLPGQYDLLATPLAVLRVDIASTLAADSATKRLRCLVPAFGGLD